FTSPPTAPYRPSLSFLPSGGTSPASVSASTSASPLTPESPVGGSGGEKYAFPGDEEKYIKQEKDSRVSAQGADGENIEDEETGAESGCAEGV
ncbi:hypothetical protein V490_07614, partial [Pseudogymnoascus sp. VKM F-3557]